MRNPLLELFGPTTRSTDGWHGHGKTWHGWGEFRVNCAAGSKLRDGIHDEVSGITEFTELRGRKEPPNRATPAD